MKKKFIGTIEELRSLVTVRGIQGKWHSDGTKHTFRSIEGGILNWWPTGTIQFQGKDTARLVLEQLLSLSIKSDCQKPDLALQHDIKPFTEGPSPDSIFIGRNEGLVCPNCGLAISRDRDTFKQ